MRGAAAFAALVEVHVRMKGFDSGPDHDCGEPGLRRLYMNLHKAPRSWVFGHFHAHVHSVVAGTEFRCVGSIDGTDRRARPVIYVLDPVPWTWTTIEVQVDW